MFLLLTTGLSLQGTKDCNLSLLISNMLVSAAMQFFLMVHHDVHGFFCYWSGTSEWLYCCGRSDKWWIAVCCLVRRLTGCTWQSRAKLLNLWPLTSQIERYLLQVSHAPWKSLNFKIKIQGLKSPWKLQSVLESPWNLLPNFIQRSFSSVWDENRRTLYFEHLMWHYIGLILPLLESLKNGKMCPWKALKSPWIFGRKKCTNPVTTNLLPSVFLMSPGSVTKICFELTWLKKVIFGPVLQLSLGILTFVGHFGVSYYRVSYTCPIRPCGI